MTALPAHTEVPTEAATVPTHAPAVPIEAATVPTEPTSTTDATVTTDVPPDAGPGPCVICQHPLMMDGEEQQALECMHVFHKQCITDYIETIGKAPKYCCPFKCFKDLLCIIYILHILCVIPPKCIHTCTLICRAWKWNWPFQ